MNRNKKHPNYKGVKILINAIVKFDLPHAEVLVEKVVSSRKISAKIPKLQLTFPFFLFAFTVLILLFFHLI